MIVQRIIIGAGGVALAVAIVWAMGADARGLGPVIAEMLTEPWSIVTLIDLYLGFAIGAVIILLFETSLWVGLLWVLPIFALGNVWTAAWFVIRARKIAEKLRGA